MEDLIKRLEDYSKDWHQRVADNQVVLDAIQEIKRLSAKNIELTRAWEAKHDQYVKEKDESKLWFNRFQELRFRP